MRRITRLSGALAAVGLAAGLTLAGPGTASATASCPAWDGTEPTSPSGGNGSDLLNGLAMVSLCDVWVAGVSLPSSSGGAEHTLIERWMGGGSWAVVPSPTPANAQAMDLNAVAADSAADAWAAGGYVDGSTAVTHGLLLHWDGHTWAQVTLPAGTGHLAAVTAISASDVWVAGGPLLLHYDGTSWTRWPLPAISPGDFPQTVNLVSMTATSASDVWAVGWLGNVPGNGEIPLTLHWDGTAWSQVPAPSPIPPGDARGAELASVSAVSPTDAWAVGGADADNSTLTMHWDGHSWTIVPSPDPAAGPVDAALNYLTGVAAVSAGSAWAVGGSATQHNGVTISDHNLALHWDGHSWAQIPVPTSGTTENSLKAVAASPAGIAFAAGNFSNQLWTSERPSMAEIGTVPNVTGDSQAAAADAMDSAGLHTVITTVTIAGGGCGPATNGTIIATTPAAGIITAAPVTMTFCDFPPVVTVPGVVGLDDSQAQGTLTNAGLTTGTITLSGNCDFPPGTVIRQNPAAGTTASRGSAVNLTEATPPKPHGCAQ